MKKIDEDLKKEIIELYLSERNMCEVAREKGISRSTIGAIISRSGLSRSKKESMLVHSNNKRKKNGDTHDIKNSTFCGVKRGARVRNLEYSITLEQAWELYLKQDKKCALTGLPITIICSYKAEEKSTASLDRINSSEGYVEGNIQWVHKDVNLIKRDMDQKEFVKMCIDITNYQDNKKEMIN